MKTRSRAPLVGHLLGLSPDLPAVPSSADRGPRVPYALDEATRQLAPLGVQRFWPELGLRLSRRGGAADTAPLSGTPCLERRSDSSCGHTAKTLPRHPLLDLAPPTPAEFFSTEVDAGRVLRSDDDVVIVQAEAALALEAVLLGVVRPGTRTLSLSSGTYGVWFANELRKLGADLTVIEVGSREAVDPADVAAALEQDPSIELVAFVHGESLSGNVNPAAEICKIVRAHGALCIVDAVASVGAHPLETSLWGIDLCIAGPQKALAGSSGTSLVSVGERAWQVMRDNPTAPRDSFLSLLDWKERWIDAGRVQIPGTPSVVEMHALTAALARVLQEGSTR